MTHFDICISLQILACFTVASLLPLHPLGFEQSEAVPVTIRHPPAWSLILFKVTTPDSGDSGRGIPPIYSPGPTPKNNYAYFFLSQIVCVQGAEGGLESLV